MIRELGSARQVRAVCGDDDLVMWAAQGLGPGEGPGEGSGLGSGGRAWALGGAVVAASPGISRHDRLAVWGDVSCAVELVRHALAELGPSYRPFGEAGLVGEVAEKLDEVEAAGRFSWMTLPAAPDGPDPGGVGLGGVGLGRVEWLGADAEAEVAALLVADAPHSYAVPGAAGVSRWAGVRVDGVLAAVAADAWSAPSVGFLAGVATASRFRGRGLAGRVCRWVSRELVAAHGRAALMVDDDNAAAIAVYGRLGYVRRRVMAAHVTRLNGPGIRQSERGFALRPAEWPRDRRNERGLGPVGTG